MTIRYTELSENIINLDGPEGNAFTLMAYAKRFAREVGYASDEIEIIRNRMMKGDYTNLVKTFDEYFGDCIILETTNKELLNA